MSEWKEYKLGDLGFFIGGVTSIKRDDYGFGTPFISYKNVYSNSKVKIDELQLMNVNKKELSKRGCIYGDIFFTASSETEDEVAMSSVLLNDIDNLTFNGFCKRYRLNDFKILLPEYARYYFRTKYFRGLIYQIVTGDIRFNVSQASLSEIKIKLPQLHEQKAIAAVLSSFDDKIELLRRQNKTLEKIAQAIFKEWFVRFNFPDKNGKPYRVSGGKTKSSELGEIPVGWRVRTLGEELSVSIGGDWGQGTKGSDGYVQAYCLRGTDIDSLKISGYSAQVPLRWIKKDSLKKRIITENDVLIGGSGLGPIGKTLYCHKNINLLYDFPITYSNFCKRLTAKNKYHALYFEYLISRLYSQGSLERFFTGTSIPNLDINGLLEEIVVIPNEKQIEDFAKIIDLKYSNLINPQVQTLSKLRDTLLPKLMKGEIRVKL